MENKGIDQIQIFEFRKEIEIAAPIEIAFEALLDELGPEGQMPDAKPMPMKLEPWPGGRWFRDLVGDAGHLWGLVQSIKPPTLLELYGQMPMSSAAVNHVQYRLKVEGDGTRLTFVHSAMGLILPELRDGMPKGWSYKLERIREIAEQKKTGQRAK